jgi:serine/threonine protein kinase
MVEELEQLSERYRLEETVASGGMGTVFRARDEVLDRTVAVKLLKETLLTDESAVERFRREARIAASLAHPGIAQVFDFGQEDARPFIVMEFLEGSDLHSTISTNGPMDPVEAANIAAKVADALDHAHAAGAIHRDVKPGNIFRTGNGHIKLTDFGIARLTSQSTVTSTGSVIGTHHYISPEMVNGEAVTPSTDIYSLGCVLYEMLTGQPPFDGETPLTIAMSHVAKPAPDVTAANPAVPDAIASIVAKAMSKDPAERFASAGEMAEALRAAQGGIETSPVDRATAVIPTATPSPAVESRDTPVNGSDEKAGPRRYTVPVWVLIPMGLALVLLLAVLLFRRETVTPQTFRLDSYVGDTFKEASATAGKLGLRVTEQTTLSTEPAGTVIDQSPRAGREMFPSGRLTLVTSDGMGVEVPGFIGFSQEGAQTILTSLGLVPVPAGEVGEEKAIVVSQDPAPETIVAKGSSVRFVLESEDNKGQGQGQGKGRGQNKED